MILDNNHWRIENYKQRVTRKELKKLLLDGEDRIFYHGRSREIGHKHVGAGIYEVFKKPLEAK